MTKRVFKDESNGEKQRASKRADVIATVEAFMGRIIEKPSVWDDPDLCNIRSMLCRIGRDRENFPLPLDEEEDDESESVASFSLSTGLGESLYRRGEMDLSNVVLQITAASWENKTTKVDNKEIPHRMWKFNAIDGDNTVVTVRLDSTLNSEGRFLTPGAIIHVTSGFPVYLNYGDLYEMRCAIVLRAFRVIGRRPVVDSTMGAPQRLSVQNQNTGVENKKAISGALSEVPDCCGRLCSKHGIYFSVCLSKCVPVANVSLAKVARECVFVTKELKDMTPNHLRFLLYYYYSTSVYQFHGKGNRVDLPECIVSAIREKHPDTDAN